jgi:hypothetical protein
METRKSGIEKAIKTKIKEAKSAKVSDRLNGMKKCVTLTKLSKMIYRVGFRFTKESTMVGDIEKSACGGHDESIRWVI